MRNDNLSSPDDDNSVADADDDAAAVTDAIGDAGSGEVPHAARRGEALIESASLGSGIGTIYKALDRVVDLYALDDAALVLDVPGARPPGAARRAQATRQRRARDPPIAARASTSTHPCTTRRSTIS